MSKKKTYEPPSKTKKVKVVKDLEHLNIQYLPIDQLKPNTYNPNRQSDHEFELLCRSIEEDGFTQPVLVNKSTMTIVDGEHRWRAMRALGFEEVPCCLTDMTPEQAMVATLRHNRARGNEDIQRAADLFRELAEMKADDWVKDSLMLDDVELNMMVNAIPSSELHLRTEDMNYEQTQDTLAQEEALEKIKHEENLLMAAKDNHKYTVQFTLLADEALIVKEVVGKEHADGILKLCKQALDQGLVHV